jgi:hypothetical protein
MASISTTTLNPILNNHHELEKINWTVPGGFEMFLKKIQNFTQKGNQSYKYKRPGGSETFFKKFKTLPKRVTKVINIEYLGFYVLLKNHYPPNTGPNLLT